MKREQEKCNGSQNYEVIHVPLSDDETNNVVITQSFNSIVLQSINTTELAHLINPSLRIKAVSALELLENGEYILAVKCLKEALEL